MFYSNEKVNELVKFIMDNFEAYEKDIRKMFGEEYENRILGIRGRKTQKAKNECLQDSINLIGGWTSNTRRPEITAEDLANFRASYLYFNSIKRK